MMTKIHAMILIDFEFCTDNVLPPGLMFLPLVICIYATVHTDIFYIRNVHTHTHSHNTHISLN